MLYVFAQGKLDDETRQLMKQARCGRPDIEHDDDDDDDDNDDVRKRRKKRYAARKNKKLPILNIRCSGKQKV